MGCVGLRCSLNSSRVCCQTAIRVGNGDLGGTSGCAQGCAVGSEMCESGRVIGPII